jgi:polyhydroxyalkanoate synthase
MTTDPAAPPWPAHPASAPTEEPARAIEQASWQRVREALAGLPDLDRLGLTELFRALAARPAEVARVQHHYYQLHRELWNSVLQGSGTSALPAPAPDDHRFDAPAWAQLPFFRLIKQLYLLNAAWLTDLVHAAALPPAQARRVAFVLHQALDAMAPTNFLATNPEVIELAARTSGASLLEGLRNLKVDTVRGRMAMTDESAFEVGRNLAITPGEVVYENPVAQLIQYAPLTARVHARPLLIVPPFINKYYILDLQPENSFVRYALEQGHQLFMVSWRNASAGLEHATWDDYARQGVVEPLDVLLEITGARQANALGFCVGGTLLASTLAAMPRRGRVASLTLLATMLDFTDVGEIGAYIDELYVQQCEAQFRDGGLMQGRRLADAFASLRANELVWRFLIENYLKGRAPPAFDLLYWNSDSANLPGPLFAWYLRNMYLENNLRIARRLRVLGAPADLGRITAPTYILATREDHIVPWTSAYSSTRLLGGTMEFVLGASGHIAGVVNPAAGGRRCYWTAPLDGSAAQHWLSQTTRVAGSWWPHWSAWLARRAGRRIPAPGALESARYPRIEPAPGRYVRERRA